MKSIHWAIVGCGWVARDYVAPAILQAPSAHLIALCDPSEQNMSRITEIAPKIKTFLNLNQLLALGELDAVYIATPNHLHRSITEACANAGKHVYCEKPMATSLADARAMVEACKKNDVQYATAFDQRFQARHQKLKQLIENGELGEITHARVHYACWTPHDWVPPTQSSHDNWRVDPKRAGGGAFIDLAPHGLDLVQWLLGEPLVEVASLLQSRVFDYPVDDGAVLIGRFQNNALLSMNVAYNCSDNFPRRTLEVIGTRAMAILQNTMGQTPGGTFKVVSASDGTLREIEVENDVSPFQTGIELFSQCLIEYRPFPFPAAHDLHTMEILEVAIQHTGGTRLNR